MELSAHDREVKGKKVRFLRRQGVTPVHLFGHNVKPLPLQCETSELRTVLNRAGTTGLIQLKLDAGKRTRNVMVREIQKEARSGELLHVDFYQIKMDEKIKVEVPVTLIGEAPALKNKENYLSHELANLNIECLPDGIPAHIEVDVSNLEEADQAIRVSDITVGEGISIITSPEQLIAKINVRFVEREEEAEAEAGAEGEAPTEAASAEGSSQE